MKDTSPRIIGLIGRKGAGKDTAAAVLLVNGYQNLKFAGGLKQMMRALLAFQGVDENTIERMVEGDLKETPTAYLDGQTPRYAMQTLGSQWGRHLIGADYWVNTALRKAGDGGHYVITDIRFWNEKAAVESLGGVVFGITADWIKPQEGEHESEAEIDDMIASLPDTQRLINRKARLGEEEFAIQEFRARFLHQLRNLGG